MALNGRKFRVKFIERTSYLGFLKKEAEQRSRDLPLTLVILFVWNK